MACLKDTVDAWRLSDVPVGALLSGGIDSASLAALLTDLSGSPIHTFTIGFEARSHDEAGPARETARALGSHHHELTFTLRDFDLLPDVVRHLEEPQCSATSVPLYLLYRACHRAGFKVIMTGEGADELLGGYPWFDGDRRVRGLLGLPRPLRALLARAPMPASPAARRVLTRGTRDPLQRYVLWHQVATPEQLAALLTFSRPEIPLTDWWYSLYAPHVRGRHPLDQFLFLEARTRLVDFINFEVDRMSMAHSVEARPPFLDHHLWECAAKLPPDLKLNSRGNKVLLRLAMRGRLPPDVLHRPKRGLAAPHATWWRAGKLPAWAEEYLHPAALTETGYFHPGEVARLRALHRSGRADTSRVLMGVLTTQIWHYEVLSARHGSG